jgi:hypothetical protein
MATFEGRFYERTIPEFNRLARAAEGMADAFDGLESAITALQEANAWLDLLLWVMRQCDGMRRRQMRRNR